MKIEEYKARSSGVGNLFTEPRLKKDRENGELSATAKGQIQHWLKERIYQRRFEFSNKYTENGIKQEDENIDYLEIHSEYKGLKKNEEHFVNELLTGTPDLLTDDKVIDIKSSFSGDTFKLFDTEITNKLYYYQLQAYMLLTGKRKAELVYVLGNTSEDVIKKEFNFSRESDYEKFRKQYIYDNVDSKYRIKRFEVAYDEDFEEKLSKKIAKAREYISKLLKEIE